MTARTLNFRSAERGSIAPLFGLMLVALAGIAGAAIDISRWNQAHSRMLNAVDGAVLAAARHLQVYDDESAAISAAETYYRERIERRVPVASSSVSFSITENKTSITAQATAVLDTPLMGLLGIQSWPVKVDSKAQFANGSLGGGTAIEVSLMLDVTGSMCMDGIGPCSSSPKLDALKKGAEDLVKILVKENNASGQSRVALVPFSTRVRVGDNSANQDLMKDLTGLDEAWSGYIAECTSGSGSGGSEDGGNWQCFASAVNHRNLRIMPCVTDRTGPAALTDEAPGSDTWLNAHDGTRAPFFQDSTNATLTSGRGETAADPAYQWNYSYNDGDCADVAVANRVLPLSKDRSLLLSRIAALESYGSTAGALGTAFAWYTLSENWNGVWGGDSKPGSYADLGGSKPKLRKVAVLMTDGVYNTERGWKDADPVVVSNRAKELCANMKAKGIEIFTVGFELDALPAGERARAIDTLQSCGTDLEHFYNTLDTTELQQAFRDIALQLSYLYLAK